MASFAAPTPFHQEPEGSPGALTGPIIDLFKDHLLGGRELSCPEVSSSCGVGASYLHAEDVESWVEQHHLGNIFGGLDFTKPSGPFNQVPSEWPSVTIRPLASLFREFRVTSDPDTGKMVPPPGTRGFVKKHFRAPGVWTGSDEEAQQHAEQVKSMNLAMLLITQESLGIDSEQLIVKLRFFTLEEALAVEAGVLPWESGSLRPDNDHLVLLLRAPEKGRHHLVPIRLIVPSPNAPEVAEPTPRAVDMQAEATSPTAAPKAKLPEPVKPKAEAPSQHPAEASSGVEGLFLPKQTSMTVDELQEATQALVARIAPGFLEQQEDARRFASTDKGHDPRPLQLYLKPEDAIRLARAGGPVTWKAKDTRDQIYNLWLASGSHIPDEAHTVACVCIQTPGRGNDTSLSLTIS